MTEQDIYDVLTRIFHDTLDEDDLELRPDLDASDVEGWDSLANVRLVVAVESVFGLKFSTVEITSLGNVGDLAALIGRKIMD